MTDLGTRMAAVAARKQTDPLPEPVTPARGPGNEPGPRLPAQGPEGSPTTAGSGPTQRVGVDLDKKTWVALRRLATTTEVPVTQLLRGLARLATDDPDLAKRAIEAGVDR